MSLEIERKFLVLGEAFRTAAVRSSRMKQGYFETAPTSTVRVRIADDAAFLTIKSRAEAGHFARSEFEYAVPVADAEAMLAEFCAGRSVEKTRYYCPVGAHIFEVDVFSGRHAGLVVAEVELKSEDEPFERPDWLDREVTSDFHYSNGYLAKH